MYVYVISIVACEIGYLHEYLAMIIKRMGSLQDQFQ